MWVYIHIFLCLSGAYVCCMCAWCGSKGSVCIPTLSHICRLPAPHDTCAHTPAPPYACVPGCIPSWLGILMPLLTHLSVRRHIHRLSVFDCVSLWRGCVLTVFAVAVMIGAVVLDSLRPRTPADGSVILAHTSLSLRQLTVLRSCFLLLLLLLLLLF